jgi:hypothetical protein
MYLEDYNTLLMAAERNPNKVGDKILYEGKTYTIGSDLEEIMRWAWGPSYERPKDFIVTTCGRVLKNDYFTNLSLEARLKISNPWDSPSIS